MPTSKSKAREYKVLLGAISVLVGLASFYVLAVSSYGFFKGIVFGLIVSLLYPIFASIAVKIIYRIFTFALVWDKNYTWSIEYQVLTGSFWPITLPVSLVMGCYSLIINRIFPEH
ncbi:MAG: hypothetical protein JSW26_06620 [Desulfobacterales bacterium]|nr:MAG: hypothetical protein JSW26_06620 [Desulfobacterales bacterium]